MFNRIWFPMLVAALLCLGGCGVDRDDNPVAPESNRAPHEPTLISPASDSADVPVNARLVWSCSDPDGDSLSYSVYFGVTDPPPLLIQEVSLGAYDLSRLAYDTRYYWKIVAVDGRGGSYGSVIHCFRTTPGVALIAVNGIILEDYSAPSDSLYWEDEQRLYFKTDFLSLLNDGVGSSLELFVLTEADYQTFKVGSHLTAVWHDALDSLGQKELLTDPLPRGWYRVVLDFTDWGWRQTNHDDALDAAMVDLKVYRRDY